MSGRHMLRARDKEGRLPLHVACSYHAGLDVIQYLVEQYPKALVERTNNGDLPVTLAATLSQSPEKRRIVYYLLRQNPEMFARRSKQSDDDGSTAGTQDL